MTLYSPFIRQYNTPLFAYSMLYPGRGTLVVTFMSPSCHFIIMMVISNQWYTPQYNSLPFLLSLIPPSYHIIWCHIFSLSSFHIWRCNRDSMMFWWSLWWWKWQRECQWQWFHIVDECHFISCHTEIIVTLISSHHISCHHHIPSHPINPSLQTINFYVPTTWNGRKG
jgi:hypothetical protein